MDEQLARLEIDDFVRRHAAVGAADPQVARRLLRGEVAEEAGVAGLGLRGPGGVAVEQVAGRGHRHCIAAGWLRIMPTARGGRRFPAASRPGV